MNYPGLSEFEANADRARESAEQLLAESLAAEAASDLPSDVDTRTQGSAMGFLDRIRSRLAAIRGG